MNGDVLAWVLTCWLLGGVVYHVHAYDILDIQLTKKEKECYGTSMGFSFSGTREYHYESLRRRFTGCTHVNGNLEVTNLNNGNVTYDLSFLSSIKFVTGYVLLGLLNVEKVPLTSLQMIRADTTLKLGSDHYALAVALTSEGDPTPENPTPGLKELQMPRLRGGSCPASCGDADGVARCWGSGRGMCQSVRRIACDDICPGRCYKEGILGCCHPQCAVGCTGGLDTECELCKHFRYGEKCVEYCPEGSFPLGQECYDF